MVERVLDSYTIAYILQKYGNDIHNFLREYNPNSNAPYGIDPEVQNTFVRSCGKKIFF